MFLSTDVPLPQKKPVLKTLYTFLAPGTGIIINKTDKIASIKMKSSTGYPYSYP